MRRVKIDSKELSEFTQKALFETVMTGGIDGWSNYIGHDWSGWLCGPSKSRDSDALARSNFRVALDMLGGEQDGKVEVRSCNHWACGYFDQIMVKLTAKKPVKVLYQIHKSLEGYPVLDEFDFSQEECDEADETFRNYCSEFGTEVLKFLGSTFQYGDLRPKRQAWLDEFTREIYAEDQGYQGIDSAWVTSESIKRLVSKKCLDRPEIRQNPFFKACLRKVG